MCVLTIFSAHFGQNQLTQKSLYNLCSYKPCKCKLKNDVCGAALLLGFPKYSSQIVFTRHYVKHYPSFWMSSVIGIIGAKVQKLTLRVTALQVGLSGGIRGWVCTIYQCFWHVWLTLWSCVCVCIHTEHNVFVCRNIRVCAWKHMNSCLLCILFIAHTSPLDVCVYKIIVSAYCVFV